MRFTACCAQRIGPIELTAKIRRIRSNSRSSSRDCGASTAALLPAHRSGRSSGRSRRIAERPAQDPRYLRARVRLGAQQLLHQPPPRGRQTRWRRSSSLHRNLVRQQAAQSPRLRHDLHPLSELAAPAGRYPFSEPSCGGWIIIWGWDRLNAGGSSALADPPQDPVLGSNGPLARSHSGAAQMGP
jgi:hypothetical protein